MILSIAVAGISYIYIICAVNPQFKVKTSENIPSVVISLVLFITIALFTNIIPIIICLSVSINLAYITAGHFATRSSFFNNGYFILGFSILYLIPFIYIYFKFRDYFIILNMTLLGGILTITSLVYLGLFGHNQEFIAIMKALKTSVVFLTFIILGSLFQMWDLRLKALVKAMTSDIDVSLETKRGINNEMDVV